MNRILWADDEFDLLKPHVLFLNSRGYDVTMVSNGVDALDLLAKESFNLVMLDENMPGLSGLETLDRIKLRHPDLPVIMITKSEEEDLMNQAIGNRIADYLIKPVNPRQILPALKKILGGKELVELQTSSDYREDFAKISSLVAEADSFEDWFSIYKRLVDWEIRLEKSPMSEIMHLQKKDADKNFSKFIKNNYRNALNGSRQFLMSPDIMTSRVIPPLNEGNKLFFIVIDNFRLDQWRMIQPLLSDYFEIHEDLCCSILPTSTQYSRNAIFSGLMPLKIKELYPSLWTDDDSDSGLNNNEEKLLSLLFERLRLNIDFNYFKINDNRSGEKFLQSMGKICVKPLNVVVLNFLDMMSHARTEFKMIRELAYSDAAYRSLTETWFRHSPAIDIFLKIAETGSSIILTTDHGTMRVENPLKISGVRELNSNLRYKTGHNIKFNSKDVFAIEKPEDVGLPAYHISGTYIFACDNDFFVYPNNLNHFVKYYSGTYQHGGVSMEEMIIPLVTLTPKK